MHTYIHTYMCNTYTWQNKPVAVAPHKNQPLRATDSGHAPGLR